MMDFIKEALSENAATGGAGQAEIVRSGQKYHGARAFQFVNDYFIERTRKHGFVDEELYAQGFDKDDFYKLLAKTKGTEEIFLIVYHLGLGPNVDFFSMQELEGLAKKFKEEQAAQQFEGAEEEQKRDGTMAGFFERNIQASEGSESLGQKMSMRRPTKRLEGTILNRHKNVICIVQA